MNRFEGLRIREEAPQSQTPKNRFEGLLIKGKNEEEQEGDSWGSLIGKSVVDKGLGPLLGLPKLVAQGIEGLARGQAESQRRKFEAMGLPGSDIETPEINALSSKLPAWEDIRDYTKDKTGVDFEARPTNAGQRIVSEAVGFATPTGLLGLPGKGAKALNALKTARTGALIGGTSQALKEAGANPIAADVGSMLFAPSAAAKLNPKNLYEGFKKAPLKIMGLSPKNLNVEAAQSARDLGIDLPAAALTESKLTGLADQFVGKTPYFGNKLQKKYLNAENQTKDALNRIYEEVGPVKTAEIESQIANLYNESVSSLPKDARIKPANLKKAIDDIKIDTAVLSQGEKDLVNTLQTIKSEIEPTSKLVSQYGPLKIPLQDFDVNKLIGTKKSLNSIIKWDMDQGVKNQLRNIQKAASKDIAEYGKKNPEWYQTFKEADNLFGKVAKREKLEGALSGKSNNAATDTLSYNALSKAINSPENNALLKKQLDPETFAKVQKLGTVAKSMAVKNRNVPNPSGTAMTHAVGGILASYYTPQAVASVIGTAGLTKLLTDKKIVDLALKYAEKPNLVKSIPLNKRIKDLTGYSAIALNRELQKEQRDKFYEDLPPNTINIGR